MSGNPCCGTKCARCGGCRAQHYKQANREYLGCTGFVPQEDSIFAGE